MKDLISVVIPVFNAEKYLCNMMDSILGQTYKKLEIILVDDGSEDNSGKICDEYALKDERIHVIHKPNTGIGETRNTGLAAAMGAYVYFVDADDYIALDTIEVLYREKEEKQADTVIGGYTKVKNSGEIMEICQYETAIYQKEEVKKKCLVRMIGSDVAISDSLKPSVWNTLYSMKVIKKHRILFADEKKLFAEDLYFNMHYFCYAGKVAISKNCSYFYRKNDASFTALIYRAKLLNQSIVMNQYEEEFLREAEIYEIAEYRLMRQFFIRLKCCLQQENIRISGKKFREAIQSMKEILSNAYVIEQLRTYPIKDTGWKQRFFLNLCLYKAALLLYICLGMERLVEL